MVYVEICNGIGEVSELTPFVFQNQSDHSITVHLNGFLNGEVVLFDIMGRKLLKFPITREHTTDVFSLPGTAFFAPGVYIVYFVSPYKQYKIKIIKS